MSDVIEVQLERMDGKLEKHIGITETILNNQQEILEDIRDIVRDHDDKFITHDDMKLIREAIEATAAKEFDKKVKGLEDRLDNKYKIIVGAVLLTIGLIYGGIEAYYIVNAGA